jgi:hypothetical protein
MNKQSLIECLEHIKDNVTRGENKAALLNLAKLEHCILQCDCDFAPDYKDFPAILRDQAPFYLPNEIYGSDKK